MLQPERCGRCTGNRRPRVILELAEVSRRARCIHRYGFVATGGSTRSGCGGSVASTCSSRSPPRAGSQSRELSGAGARRSGSAATQSLPLPSETWRSGELPVHPGKLLVEGKTDQCVIPYLMEANGVPWPDYRDPDCPAFIADSGSVNEILKPEVIEAELRASGLEALGVVVDADGDASARWDELRALWDREFADLPDQIPAGGPEVCSRRQPEVRCLDHARQSVPGNARGLSSSD